MLNIPKTVKVGGHIQTVEILDTINGGNETGLYKATQDRILIAKHVLSEKGKKELIDISESFIQLTFLHELLHAINFIFSGDSLSEKEIDHISEGLFQVMVDNPCIFTRGKNAKTR